MTTQKRWVAIATLSTLVLLGGLLRLHDLSKSTIGHIEMYVPGIELPPVELSDPAPRLTLVKTITGPIAWEPHPPGYYVFMFPWTKLFGTSVMALRLPSVLFGVASILLIYILGTLAEDKLTGLLAAGMLAFHGYHLFWSQIAKMYQMGTFLGLLSTVLLLWAVRSSVWSWVVQLLYMGVTLAGLAVVVFFWPLFLTQMLWILGNSLTKSRSVPGLFRQQLLVFILGSPLLATAAHYSQRPSYLTSNFLVDLGQFLQFGFLLEAFLFQPDPWAVSSNSGIAVTLIVFLVLVALFLIIVAFRSSKLDEEKVAARVGPPSIVMLLASVFAFVSILLFAKIAQERIPSPTKLIVGVSIIPVLLLLLDSWVRRHWGYVSRLGGALLRRLVPLNGFGLNFILAILPVTAILVMSLFVPLFAPRTILLFTPYLLIVLSKGLASLIQQNKIWIVLVLVLAVNYSMSILHFKDRLKHSVDYKDLADQWIPNIERTDLIFVQRHWKTTPIFYYLKSDRYNFVGRDYAEKIVQQPNSRVWVLSLKGVRHPEAMENAVADYEQLMNLEALRINAELFGRR